VSEDEQGSYDCSSVNVKMLQKNHDDDHDVLVVVASYTQQQQQQQQHFFRWAVPSAA